MWGPCSSPCSARLPVAFLEWVLFCGHDQKLYPQPEKSFLIKGSFLTNHSFVLTSSTIGPCNRVGLQLSTTSWLEVMLFPLMAAQLLHITILMVINTLPFWDLIYLIFTHIGPSDPFPVQCLSLPLVGSPQSFFLEQGLGSPTLSSLPGWISAFRL